VKINSFRTIFATVRIFKEQTMVIVPEEENKEAALFFGSQLDRVLPDAFTIWPSSV